MGTSCNKSILKGGTIQVHFTKTLVLNGVINGKASKAAALPKFSDTLTLLQPGGRLCLPIGFALPTKIL